MEFALVLPILVLVLFGVLDLGRVFFATISLTNAAREGVRYLTLHPGDVDNEFGGAISTTITEADYAGISVLAGDVNAECFNEYDEDDENCDSGYPATVTVAHDFELVLGWFLPSPISITRSAIMIIP